MEASWNWITLNYETMLNVLWDFFILLLTVSGVVFGWKGIKLSLPSKKNKAKKEIINHIHKYLIENENCSANDIRSMIKSIHSEHSIDSGTLSENEIINELKSSIIVSPLLDKSVRELILKRLNNSLEVLDWAELQISLSSCLGDYDFGKEEIKKEIIEAVIQRVKSYVNFIEEQQDQKTSFILRAYSIFSNKILFLGTTIAFFLAIYFLVGVPIKPADLAIYLLMMIPAIYLFFIWLDYKVKKCIDFLGSSPTTHGRNNQKLFRFEQWLDRNESDGHK